MAKGLGQQGKTGLNSQKGTQGNSALVAVAERRRWPRRQVERLLAYSWLDQDQKPLDMGMAKTLDLSEGGAGILIHRALVGGETLHLFMAVEENLVETTAKVVYQKPLPGGYYQIGACFLSMEEKARRCLTGPNFET